MSLGVPTLETGFPLLWALAGVPLLTLLGHLVTLRRRRVAAVVALTGALLTAAISVLALWQEQAGVLRHRAPTLGPVELPGWRLGLTLVASPATVAAVSVLAVIWAVTQLFAHWYLAYDERYAAFATALSAASCGTLLVLLGGDLALVAGGWCLVAVAGAAVTAHWADDGAGGAVQVGVTLGTGCLLLVGGLLLLAAPLGRGDLGALSAAPPAGRAVAGAVLVAVAVLIGAGQLPATGWVTLLARGPLPGVVAVQLAGLGAASAGLVLRLQPALTAVPAARWTLAVAGAATAVIGAGAALVQRDLRDVATLLGASGLGNVLVLACLRSDQAPDAAWYAMLSVVLGAGLLTLVACWMSVLVGATTMARTSRLARHHTPLRFPLAAALVALAGLPPFAGFVGQHVILTVAARGGTGGIGGLARAVALITLALAAATACRVWLVLTHRTSHEETLARRGIDSRGTQIDDFFAESTPEPEGEYVDDADNDVESWALAGLVLLSLLCVAGGAVALTPVLDIPDHLDARLALLITGVVVVAALVSVLLGWRRFHNDAVYVLPGRLVDRCSARRWAPAPLRAVAALGFRLARLARTADERGLGAATDGVGSGAKLAARVAQRFHASRPTSALAVVSAGALLLALVGVVAW